MSVLREILKVLPREKYVYYADNAWCPYGEKSRQVIIGRAREITRTLLSHGAQVIVVACNTATAAAISVLRSEFGEDNGLVSALTGGRMGHVRFVGMEPAVKPAALGTRSGVVGVLATAGTLSSSNYLDVRGRYGNHVRIVEHAGVGFVEMVEHGELDSPKTDEVVGKSLAPLLAQGADTVVLGCTHYPFLIGSLRRMAKRLAPGREVKFIDPAPAVARQLVNVMTAEGLLQETPGGQSITVERRLEQKGGLAVNQERERERRDGQAASPERERTQEDRTEPDVLLLSSGPVDPLERTYGLIRQAA